MPSHEQQRPARKDREYEEVEEQTASTTQDENEDVDGILDEIDDVLESNAEEFVRGFVQKGGQ